MPIGVKRIVAPLCVPVCALAVAACGSSTASTAFQGESHEAAQAITNFQNDTRGGDQQQVCARDLAGAIVTRLSRASGGCKEAFKTQLGEVDSYELTIQSIQLGGTGARRTASARVRSIYSGKKREGTLSLVKEAGKWKISGVQ
jgi:hypothetical protein